MFGELNKPTNPVCRHSNKPPAIRFGCFFVLLAPYRVSRHRWSIHMVLRAAGSHPSRGRTGTHTGPCTGYWRSGSQWSSAASGCRRLKTTTRRHLLREPQTEHHRCDVNEYRESWRAATTSSLARCAVIPLSQRRHLMNIYIVLLSDDDLYFC